MPPTVPGLNSRIPLIIADLDDTVLDGVIESAERIVLGAKERVPVDSGELRDAIHVEADRDAKSVSVVAGDGDTFYGHIVENGSVKTGPRPFLVPAYEAERENLEDIVGEKLEEL